MYHTIERNERRNRRNALFLAVVFHLALGTFLYFQANEKPAPASDLTQTTVKTTGIKSRALAQP